MKANKRRNELKVLDSNTYRLKNEEHRKNEQRTVKNDKKSSRKHLGSLTEAPRLGFSSPKTRFSPKIAEMHSQGVRDPFEQPPFSYL